MTEESVRVYTDGACTGNPGPGGYGLRIRYPDGRVKEFGGGERDTTNNRMELLAVIEALRHTREEPSVFIVTDSEYVRRGITVWLEQWKARGWLTREKRPVANQDLWRTLDGLLRPGVTFGYTAGHAGDPDNERCDLIATSFAKGSPVELEDGVDHTPFAPLRRRTGGKGEKRGRGGAAVYLSYVGGMLERHTNWEACERAVKGRSGARYKKCYGPEEERETLEKWGLPPEEV